MTGDFYGGPAEKNRDLVKIGQKNGALKNEDLSINSVVLGGYDNVIMRSV